MGEKIEWKPEYSVGVRLLDYDHQELFEVVNEFNMAIERGDLNIDELAAIIDRLSRYVLEHFQREEHIMHEYGFPDITNHRKAHHDFARTIYAVRHIFANSPDRISPDKLLKYLKNWLTFHIKGEDFKYRDYLHGNYGRRHTDIVQPIAGDNASSEKERRKQSDFSSVTVSVPIDKEIILRRCARILQLGGEKAVMLEDLTDPVGEITDDQALEIAKFVLE